MENLERVLRAQPFLADLDAEHLAFMVGCAQNVRFIEGTYLFRDGQPSEAMYLFRDGRVALEVHVPGRGRVVIETLEQGDVTGWSWLFPPYKWHVDARALEPILAIRFDGRCLRNKLEADHDLGYVLTKKLLATVHHRLERVRLQGLDVYRPGVP